MQKTKIITSEEKENNNQKNLDNDTDEKPTNKDNDSKEKQNIINEKKDINVTKDKFNQNIKFENNDISPKYIFNKEITNEIIIEEKDEVNNIPNIIIYDNHKYIMTTINPENHNKNTHKCILWRLTKDKTTNNYNFCSSTITC